MNLPEFPRTDTSLRQVYLMERDSGLLCRILGLYAARGMDVLHVDYSHAAEDVVKLQISVAATDGEAVRVLLDKASTLVGVLAACDQLAHPSSHRFGG
ncbi:MAG: hypothetical protein KKC79_17525 [Gammaproteobacteria bacterium]|nr:hypothetical protein [Gammaproteobacteria bacterium]MBU1441586.1 hypothetical protein [Gammaproteobacteria bacterium]MBU2287068.1 hypothetical protein [Gammaproteobacteria bacterium]MBU2410436.1 hypothetical protein [Gammaproteobacteria bacterium]